MKKNKGFTLTELLIVIAVMGILFAIALPNLQQMFQSNRISTQVNEFIATLNLARSEAIKRGEAVNVTATDSSDSNNEWGPGWTVTSAGGDTLLQFDGLESNMTLDSAGDYGSFQYQASGLIDNSDTLDLCDDRTGEIGRQVSITATGRVSVSDVTCP